MSPDSTMEAPNAFAVRGSSGTSSPGADADFELHPALVRETLQKFADLLRVGRLLVNGEEITWSTSSSNVGQLRAFFDAFSERLRRLPETASLPAESHQCSAHLVCKALSINYALSEVVQLLQEKLGEGSRCSIRLPKRSAKGRECIDYGVDILPGRIARAFVTWHCRGNIVTCSPKTAKMKVCGTLSHVETQFYMEPTQHGFKPTYRFHIEYHGSRMAELRNRFAKPFRCQNKDDRKRSPISVSHAESLDSGLIEFREDCSALDRPSNEGGHERVEFEYESNGEDYDEEENDEQEEDEQSAASVARDPLEKEPTGSTVLASECSSSGFGHPQRISGSGGSGGSSGLRPAAPMVPNEHSAIQSWKNRSNIYGNSDSSSSWAKLNNSNSNSIGNILNLDDLSHSSFGGDFEKDNRTMAQLPKSKSSKSKQSSSRCVGREVLSLMSPTCFFPDECAGKARNVVGSTAPALKPRPQGSSL